MIATALLATALSTNPVDIALSAAHAGFARQQADRFADTSAPEGLEGRRFILETTPIDGETRGSFGHSSMWVYENGKLRFSLSVHENPYDALDYDEPRVLVAEYRGVNLGGGSYVGENAYGARRQVAVENWRISGVAMLTRPTGQDSAYGESLYERMSPIVREAMDASRKKPENLRDYWVEVPVQGEAARSMARNVRLVIEGALAPLPTGGLTKCHRRHRSPSIDQPNDLTFTRCWVGANVTRIAFVNRATGSVLKEWIAPSEP